MKAKTIVLSVFLIAVLSFVVAAKDSEDAPKLIMARNAIMDKNMTFGNCVSDAAVIKHSCYATVKDACDVCKATASNQTEPKPALKECKTTYKKDKKQCKMGFKSAKKECGKIKHSFMDSVRVMFK